MREGTTFLLVVAPETSGVGLLPSEEELGREASPRGRYLLLRPSFELSFP